MRYAQDDLLQIVPHMVMFMYSIFYTDVQFRYMDV